jgi:hypothetical protein
LHDPAFTLAALFLVGMGTVESRNKNPESIDLGTEVEDQNVDPVKAATAPEKTEAQLLPVVSRGVQRTE